MFRKTFGQNGYGFITVNVMNNRKNQLLKPYP